MTKKEGLKKLEEMMQAFDKEIEAIMNKSKK